MAPILSSLLRREDPSANSNLAYYLLISCVAIFVSGVLTIISYCIFRRARRTRRQRAQALHAATQNEADESTSSLIKEKSSFYDEELRSPVGSPPPQIRLTLPEENVAGQRKSRVVVVTMSENGSVGYAPYHEALPITQQKESTRFQSLDLERIGGLKEAHAM